LISKEATFAAVRAAILIRNNKIKKDKG